MNYFDYSIADDITVAVQSLTNNKKAKLIAGGTNLLDLMKEHIVHPEILIDINKLPNTNAITENSDGGLRLGALVSNADTAYDPLVEKRYPILSKAILAGASPQLRNMATNGGNLLQRTRCSYFYDITMPCNKRLLGSGCSAIGGYNRMNAILGTSQDCIAVYPSDMSVALAVLEATVVVAGINGERYIPFEKFHRLPGNTPNIDNELAQDEVIIGIDLPPQGFSKNYSYLKIRDRSSYAFALVSVATAFELSGNTITTARMALGGVAHKPWRSKEAEAFLQNKPANAANFDLVADIILEGAKGYGHNDFKIPLAKRAIVRNCLTAAKEQATS